MVIAKPQKVKVLIVFWGKYEHSEPKVTCLNLRSSFLQSHSCNLVINFIKCFSNCSFINSTLRLAGEPLHLLFIGQQFFNGTWTVDWPLYKPRWKCGTWRPRNGNGKYYEQRHSGSSAGLRSSNAQEGFQASQDWQGTLVITHALLTSRFEYYHVLYLGILLMYIRRC